jgi:hypothetical protein
MGMFESVPIVPSAARTTSGNSGAVAVHGASVIAVGVNVTAVSGTTPSLALSVEWSFDGVNFGAGETPVTLAAITATKNTSKRVDVAGPYYRLVWTITGTTPSFTFAAFGSGIAN